MLYCYDQAICNDLKSCLSSFCSDTVKVIDSESIIELVAQIKEDKIKLPLVYLTRNTPVEIDNRRTNYTHIHKGCPCVIDKSNNMIYNEKAIPVNLKYTITIVTSNRADMDEMVREILFKYSDYYFLSIKVPYESKRTIRFGITCPKDSDIETSSSTSDYLTKGTLYQTLIPLVCEGAVELQYTPHHLVEISKEIDIIEP